MGIFISISVLTHVIKTDNNKHNCCFKKINEKELIHEKRIEKLLLGILYPNAIYSFSFGE